MRLAKCAVLLAAGALCACAIGEAAPRQPSELVPPRELYPSGREPEAVHERLSTATNAEVSRACGNVSYPWAYRGAAGRRMTLRDFGRRKVGADWTRSVAGLLLRDASVDSALLVPSVQSPCEATNGLPIYLVRFDGPGRPTFAVLRFDIAVALFFDAELPLGMIRMGDRADSLWEAIGAILDDDPLFRHARPAVASGDSAPPLVGDFVSVDQPPHVVERVGPVYPDDARRTNVQGTVWLRLRVGTDGAVQDAVVALGPPELRDAALEAVWQWRFKPAANHGVPVAVWVSLPVKFTLR